MACTSKDGVGGFAMGGDDWFSDCTAWKMSTMLWRR